MRTASNLSIVLSGATMLALLAGCSGGGVGTPTVGSARAMSVDGRVVTRSSVLRPSFLPLHHSSVQGPGYALDDASKGGSVFLSDYAYDVVDIFTGGKQTGQITGFSGPQGLASTATGEIYVANTNSSNVLVYKAPFKKAIATIADPNQYPVDVAVSPAGVVALTNLISTSGGLGSVTFYAKGKTSPSYTVSNSALAHAYFEAFDKAGNLFVDGENANAEFVVGEIKAKSKAITILTISNSIAFPGGVQVNTKDDVVIGDQSGAAVYTYSLEGTKLTVKATTPLTGSADAVTFALTSTDADLYAADVGNADLYEFAYPKGGSPIETVSLGNGSPVGVAVTPVEKP